MSALAASLPSALNSSTSVRQDPGSPASPMDMQSALAELGTLRSEMAALQAALTVLKGITHSTSQQDCDRALQPDGSCASPPAHHDVHTVPIIQYKNSSRSFAGCICKTPLPHGLSTAAERPLPVLGCPQVTLYGLERMSASCVLPEAFCECFPMPRGPCAGDRSASAMGSIRPRTPTKASLTARAHALKRSRVAQHQQMDMERKPQAEPVASAAAAHHPPPSNLQVNLLLSDLSLCHAESAQMQHSD